MILSAEQIMGLPVKTKSGGALGKVSDLELDSETSQIVNYIVASINPIKKVLASDLVIGANQVISLSDKEMVVDDAVVSGRQVAEEFV